MPKLHQKLEEGGNPVCTNLKIIIASCFQTYKLLVRLNEKNNKMNNHERKEKVYLKQAIIFNTQIKFYTNNFTQVKKLTRVPVPH